VLQIQTVINFKDKMCLNVSEAHTIGTDQIHCYLWGWVSTKRGY